MPNTEKPSPDHQLFHAQMVEMTTAAAKDAEEGAGPHKMSAAIGGAVVVGLLESLAASLVAPLLDAAVKAAAAPVEAWTIAHRDAIAKYLPGAAIDLARKVLDSLKSLPAA